jgi:ankyrin repeat protein
MGGEVSVEAKGRLEKGSQSCPVDRFGDSDLHMLAKGGPPPKWLRKCILNQKPETINCINQDGYSVFHTAMMTGNKDFCRMLLKHPKLVVCQIRHGMMGPESMVEVAESHMPDIAAEMRRHPNCEALRAAVEAVMTDRRREEVGGILQDLLADDPLPRRPAASGSATRQRPALISRRPAASGSAVRNRPAGGVRKRPAAR